MSSITYNKITINNYKSLRDFELDMNKLNVLVGPNGSGKTNVVDAFITLKEVVRPLGYPLYLFHKVMINLSHLIMFLWTCHIQ